MEQYVTETSQQGGLTPTEEPRSPTSTPSSRHPSSAIPETPETNHYSEPPTQPPNPPKIRIKRRRAIFPTQEQLQLLASSDDLPLPTIELQESTSTYAPYPITPVASSHQGFLAPSSSSSLGRFVSPPKTPVHQIFTGVDEYEAQEQDWTASAHKRGEEIERPLSALSVFSDSSASSRSSSDTSPSFGGSCTSPESESSDPFVFNESSGKMPHLSSPLALQSSKHPHKRQKTQKKIKWTNDMDEHLWVTYMSYLSDPTVTPFKTLPGSAPPLGVCHRVAREAKKTWRGPRGSISPIPEDRSTYPFTSLDATVMRESSAPPRTAVDTSSADTIRPRPSHRPHSSNDISRKPIARWPRSEASTRRRLRELCKHKPMLPPHYQRLMQTRTPSPFESSSSRTRQRSSRLSPQPSTSEHGSSFSTRDLNFTLATSTSATMQPGGPLSQLASDARTPRQSDVTPSSHSSVRGAHQKSQSLQLGLGLGGEQSSSMRMLASPFQEIPKRGEPRLERDHVRQETERESARDVFKDAAATVRLDSPLKIHAPRPMSGSMKRRAEYQLGEELIADDVDARRNFLEGLFHDAVTDGHRRVRSRGFSLGAMRHSGRPARHLSELFSPPSVQEQPGSQPDESLKPSKAGQDTPTETATPVASANNSNNNNDNNSNLAPPTAKYHARRLGSPFAPISSSGFSNTFPRSLFPHGLDSISAWEQQQQQQRVEEHGESETQPSSSRDSRG